MREYLINGMKTTQKVKEDQVVLPRNGKRVRRGNMAHITKFANELIKIATTDKKVEGYLNRFPEWNSVVVPALKIVNELNNKQIGGYHPRDLHISIFGEAFNPPEDMGVCPVGQIKVSSFGLLNAYTTPEPAPQQQQQHHGMQNSLQPVVVAKPENFVDNSPSLRLINGGSAGGDYSFSSFSSPPKEPSSFGEKVESLKSSSPPPIDNSPSIRDHKVVGENKFSLQALTVPTSSYSTPTTLSNQVSSPLLNEPPKKLDLNPPEKNNLNLNNLVAKWDLEHSPSQSKKTFDLEDGFKHLVSQKSEETNVAASPTGSRSLRNSMIDLRSSSKMKLKIKNSDRTDGKKILEMIDSYKGPNLNRSLDLAYSEGNYSESENLSGDFEFEPQFSTGFKNH